MNREQIDLTIARARIEGTRMAHLAEKAKSDAQNFRAIAKLLPATGDGRIAAQFLNDLAARLERLE